MLVKLVITKAFMIVIQIRWVSLLNLFLAVI